MAFLPGYNKKVTWTPVFGGLATFNVTEHSWEEKIDALDITHSGTAGVQYMLAGILRGDGNMKCNSDDAQIVTNATIQIQAGARGVMNFYHFALGANPFVVPCIITNAPFKSVVAGLCTYEATIRLDGSAGTYVRPS